MQVSKLSATNSCQPLKQITSAQPIREISFKSTENSDLFQKQNEVPVSEFDFARKVNDDIEQKILKTDSPASSLDKLKYDFACRLAAYNAERADHFETLYKELSSKKTCVV